MYLKSLTLRGFKSFASATTLNFEPGITCVVGPNGSGKSNVVDALSWVMGEQGAKSLRGGKMEDVIFAGTAGRAPLGRAEVVLTIDNTDGALPIEYAEVTISRTMFRNGGSEYAINGSSARLLDVQDLLSDSGIGREMHVIVGQGQLDSILQATPEGRRGFIEEAAGVLKHRKRKEKALRKLEATEGNLNRLSDLITEIRRQLKPLGRQAEVARKAAVIQAEVRDARARLIADDLVQATLALESELADEAAMRERRRSLEAALEQARQAETAAEEAVRSGLPRLTSAQETWYSLAALRERVATTVSIAAERMRNADDDPAEERRGRDPEDLEAEADRVSVQERQLAVEVQARAEALKAATSHRGDVEAAHQAEETRLAGLVRAAADRREGLARLTGQVNSLRSRAEAAEAEIGRLTSAQQLAQRRAEDASRAFTSLETKVAGLDAGELGLDAEHEAAQHVLDELDEQLARVRSEESAAAQERAGLAARVEALQLGLTRKDAAGALLAATDQVSGLLGSVAALVSVQAGYETAIAAAFGAAADAVAVAGLDAAVGAFDHLKAEDLGRAGLLLGDAGPTDDPGQWPPLPDGFRYAVQVVDCRADLLPAVHRVLRKVALVDDLDAARTLVSRLPDLVAVTRDGDVLSAHFAAGGSSAQPSLIEVQAAIDDAEQRLAEANHACERLRFAQTELQQKHSEAVAEVEVTLARLHESDAAMAAIAEELGQLSSTAKSAMGEAERLKQAIAAAEAARDSDLSGLSDLEHRLEVASETVDEVEPDPTERDRLAEQARVARAAEMDARLALRTQEERVRALAGRADNLRRAAEHERQARAKARARRERLIREAQVARAVHHGATQLAARVELSLTLAATERTAAEAARAEAEAELSSVRKQVRALGADFESLVDSAHRDEMARAEQRMRVESLAEKGLTELGLEAEALIADFGPDQPVPVLTRDDGSALTEEDEQPAPVAYVREEQQKRLRRAERALGVLGRVNPLALEEFDAMEERHRFLSEQLDDLRRTRRDLMEIIEEVDHRVEQVFAQAYADVEQAFERVFARLFPGGEGRLILTEPGNWLTTGVDVEARPPGKKVKRLSLLSGGERSLIAVAFLVSLFIARPSPFYILDEVEAALDDTNLGRLLEIYEELRTNSQLLVITHQKRTMEVADALYGVTMRGDGVSAVISQRLRNAESVA
ncbi:chromosome segregation protein SMC [Microlunatus panaciterrae]|uniref:Chromosome partition protein Smc n=1 Tax=Microlunatus panaciterrae TaxID=400768 RepID=A0ABS2RMX6_9ACTN|nr:chromosome segregation protein SMC [Microlunatus panaciterrae]MBM7800354.1 chromosome segregation protein [Microlunatus panaciterrae]